MRFLLIVCKIIHYIVLIIFAFPALFIFYFYEVYMSVAVMTFKGHMRKRIKKSYYEFGYVINKSEPDPKKRFGNQILGAIVFVPITLFALMFLTFAICHYGKKWLAD